MKPAVCILGLLVLLSGCSSAPRQPATPAKSGADAITLSVESTWHYLVQLPKEYREDGPAWPLVVFLHGSGERGSDLQLVARHGPPKLVAQGREFPFILVSPQCPEFGWWSAASIDVFVEQLSRRYHVDRQRVYLTGLSMGGFGTWDAAGLNPARYAAIAPICGGGELPPAILGERLKNLPVWAFHGAKDPLVQPAFSQERVDAVNAAGGHAKLTMYPDAGHDSWSETYANPAFYEWLLAQKRPALANSAK